MEDVWMAALAKAREAYAASKLEADRLEDQLKSLRSNQNRFARIINDLSDLAGIAVDLAGDAKPAPSDGFRLEEAVKEADVPGVRHADAIFQVLKAHPQPLRVGEIIRILRDKGHKLPEATNIAFNTVYSAMKRRRDVFDKLSQGYWALLPHCDLMTTLPEREEVASAEKAGS